MTNEERAELLMAKLTIEVGLTHDQAHRAFDAIMDEVEMLVKITLANLLKTHKTIPE